MAVIRRLSKAPRVIVLVATIGVAELAQAVTHALPDYRTGELQIDVPEPDERAVDIRSVGVGPFHMHDITVTGPQLLAIIVVPLITPRAVVAARPHALRRGGAGDRDQRRPRPPHRHEPEDDVDRDLDDRRLPLGRRR